jgi:hypothetical protein
MALKSDYLINYGGEIFIIEATEKEIRSALKVLKNIRAWRCEEVEQEKQSPQVQRHESVYPDGEENQGR